VILPPRAAGAGGRDVRRNSRQNNSDIRAGIQRICAGVGGIGYTLEYDAVDIADFVSNRCAVRLINRNFRLGLERDCSENKLQNQNTLYAYTIFPSTLNNISDRMAAGLSIVTSPPAGVTDTIASTALCAVGGRIVVFIDNQGIPGRYLCKSYILNR